MTEFRDWLINIIGRKLISVLALIYVYDGEEKTLYPQELLLSFESGLQGKLSCGSDGESLVWDDENLVSSNLGEYGEQVVRDISYLPCWKNLVGHIVKDVKLIKSLREPCLMGLLFTFENDLSVAVVNLGDEMFMFESLPEEIVREELIKYYSIEPARVGRNN